MTPEKTIKDVFTYYEDRTAELSLPCYICKGKGSLEDDFSSNIKTCSFCNGTGLQPLPITTQQTQSPNIFLETLQNQKTQVTDNIEEIRTVLTDFFSAIYIFSDRKVIAKIDFYNPNDTSIQVLYPIYSKDICQTIMLENNNKTVLAFWNQNIKGYPCEITQGLVKIVCRNKEDLIDTLIIILSDGIVLKTIQKIMNEKT